MPDDPHLTPGAPGDEHGRVGRDRVCVGAVLVREGDRGPASPPLLLLGRRRADRAYYPGVWDVPGGHLEDGKTAEQALVRELREEAGVTPTAWWPLGEFHEPRTGGDGSLVLYLYAVTAWTGVASNCSPEEHSEVSWFTVEDACRLTLAHEGYPALLRQAASGFASPRGWTEGRAWHGSRHHPEE